MLRVSLVILSVLIVLVILGQIGLSALLDVAHALGG